MTKAELEEFKKLLESEREMVIKKASRTLAEAQLDVARICLTRLTKPLRSTINHSPFAFAFDREKYYLSKNRKGSW